MRILFLNAYFTPELISFSHLESDLIQRLIKQDNELSVLCPTPTRGVSSEVRSKYRKMKKEDLYDGRVKVTRFWAPREGKNPFSRAIRYFWCNFKQYLIGKKAENIDAIFATSTPPTQGVLCAMVAKRLSKKYKRKVPIVYNLQDVFPDSLVTTGLAKKGSLLWKVGRKIENYTYIHADKIIVISNAFKRNIMEKGVPEEKIIVIPNWVNVDNIKPVARKDNNLIEEYNINPDKFIVVYAGNFGAAQGAHIIIKVAEMLKEQKDIQFVIFGGGTEFEAVKQAAETMDNVIVDLLLPPDRVSEVYSLGDVALITCKKGVGNSGMPSKTWSIMACNTPIIASFDKESELAEILTEARAGVVVEPENERELAEAIIKMKEDRHECNARDYVCQNASAEVCTGKYADVITKIASEYKR